jgi:hypothetical protein
MKILLASGIFFVLVGSFEVYRMLIVVQHLRQTGIVAVAGGGIPFASFAFGIFLLLVAAVVRAGCC